MASPTVLCYATPNPAGGRDVTFPLPVSLFVLVVTLRAPAKRVKNAQHQPGDKQGGEEGNGTDAE